jgi:hypothetical protein
MISLILLLFLAIDTLIRESKDTLIKKIWIRLIKRPILPRIITYFNTVVKPFMLSYINTENGKIEFNTNKLISDLSKYSYKLLYVLLGLITLSILYYIYF